MFQIFCFCCRIPRRGPAWWSWGGLQLWRSRFDFSRSSLALHRPHCVETTAECGGTCPWNSIWKPFSEFDEALTCVIRRRMRALLPESAIRIMNQHGTITRIIQISQELDNTNSKTRNSESFCCGPMFWTCFLSIFYCRIGIQGMAGTASLRSTCVELDSIIWHTRVPRSLQCFLNIIFEFKSGSKRLLYRGL